MKNFVKENWYKLMIGSSMMMASFGFMIYTISPAYSNSDKEKTEIKNTGIPNAYAGANGVIVGDFYYFVDGGYVYVCHKDYVGSFFNFTNPSSSNEKWVGTDFKLDYKFTGYDGKEYYINDKVGGKIKLP
jgi:hypothetical protein